MKNQIVCLKISTTDEKTIDRITRTIGQTRCYSGSGLYCKHNEYGVTVIFANKYFENMLALCDGIITSANKGLILWTGSTHDYNNIFALCSWLSNDCELTNEQASLCFTALKLRLKI